MFPVSKRLPTCEWRPVAKPERYAVIDILRGLALFGVLLVNTETVFRIPLVEHIQKADAPAGWADRITDAIITDALQFKAVTIFSFLFGAGMAIQAERARKRGVSASRFLIRRMAVLLLIGMAHLLLIWNGDILTLYAVCGLLLVAAVRLPALIAFLLGTALMTANFFVSLPAPPLVLSEAGLARKIYANGSFAEILRFRLHETWTVILPLLTWILLSTAGLMCIGMAAWRSGLLADPQRHRRKLLGAFVAGGALGIWLLASPIGAWLLATCYAAAVLLWFGEPRGWLLTALAAMGRTALTNYLSQSVVLGFVFYGYGFGLFGRIGSAAAAAIAVTLYATQLAISVAWLRRFGFGPVEWLWRRLAYGRPLDDVGKSGAELVKDRVAGEEDENRQQPELP